jgi:hypothetical protein
VDRASSAGSSGPVTYVGLEIIQKLATILEVEPAEFFGGLPRSGSRRKSD